jgi:hypothetical protein
MNGNTGGSRGRSLLRRSPLRRLGAQGAALAAVALLAAGCGGGGGGSSSAAHSTAYQKELAYSECMRAHGVSNFPDPGSDGIISIHGGGAAKAKGTSGRNQSIGGPQMTRANNACQHLLPNGGVPTAAQRQQLANQGLKFAECMRAHGISNYPDPSGGGGPTTIGGSGINIQSPQFQAANRACSKDLRGGGGIRIAS